MTDDSSQWVVHYSPPCGPLEQPQTSDNLYYAPEPTWVPGPINPVTNTGDAVHKALEGLRHINSLGETDQETVQQVIALLEDIAPQEEGELLLELGRYCTLHNTEGVTASVNAELSHVESFLRVAKIEQKYKFFVEEGVWTAKRLAKITVRTVDIMDLGDDR